MRTLIILLLATVPVLAQQCVGPRCPLYMAPMGDDSDLDKAIVACNQHALGGLQIGKYDAGFAGCRDVYAVWTTSPARDRYIQEMRSRARR